MYLQTERVLLRHYRSDDRERLLDLNSDPEVMKYLGGGPGTPEDFENGIARTLLYQKKYGGRLGLFVSELRASAEFMGWFILRPARHDLDNEKVLELGYRLKKKFWGKGCATEV